ncbi:hypothetical protein BpHYR1_020173 [Brachionus plicatilis]|uniref:Uncharacterized protein n=1 Tax=Brachionus plicatilis TaxID=10195 RepID=A0A3M7QMC8_BRAPC|nr:hypothetical protein BpHYR1_020173 [Brachionus plicatilis]
MYKWEKAFIQGFVDIDARIDELNAPKPKKYHNFRISNLNTINCIIYCASSNSLLCKVRHKMALVIVFVLTVQNMFCNCNKV